jgi:hypothetical protein
MVTTRYCVDMPLSKLKLLMERVDTVMANILLLQSCEN